MALGEPYTTGTISLTADSDTVAGLGTLWASVAEPGDEIHAQGLIGVVETVTSDTAIKLYLPWAGATATGLSYVLLKRSPNRYDPAITQDKLRAFLAALADAGGVVYAVTGEAPDPGLGTDGQSALKSNVTPWRAWRRESGAWVEQSPPSLAVEYAGAWSAPAAYDDGALVTYDGSLWLSRAAANLGHQPDTSPSWWALVARRGDVGPQGPQGPQGPAGTNGWVPTAADRYQYSTGAGTAVEGAITAAGRALLASTGPLSNRSIIINGNCAVNQRAVSGTVTLAAGAYGHDRWRAGAGGCTYTFAASGIDTVITVVSGTLLQVIEGVFVEGGIYTASWTGTAQARVYQGAPSGAYASGPITTGSLAAATNTTIEFSAGTLTRVQVEPGAVATAFERRDDELQRCQRYYYLHAYGNVQNVGAGGFAGSSQVEISVDFPVTMRAAPLLEVAAGTNYYTAYTGSGAININTFTIFSPTRNSALLYNSSVSGTNGYYARVYTNSSSALIAFSAEI